MKKFNIKPSHFFNSFAVLIIFALVGIGLIHQTFAATGSLSFSPASGTYLVGSTFTVNVVENSGTDASNTVDAVVNFPSNLLKFVSDTTVGPFNFNPASDTANGGSINITRSQLGTSSTGSQVVTTITFQVLAAGSANVTFDASSDILSAVNSSNLLVNRTSATYTLNNPPPAAPVINSFTASPSSVETSGTSTLSWTSTNVVAGGCNIGSSLTSGAPSGSWSTPALTSSASYTLTCKNSANATTSKAVTVTVATAPPSGGGGSQPTNPKSTSTKVNNVTVPNNGNVQVTDPSTVQPATIQTEGVSKVEYYLNGKLVDTETKAPFTYKIDTTKYSNGSYALVSKTYYTNGSTKSVTQHIQIKNAANKVNAGNVGVTFAILLAIIGGIIYAQRRRRLSPINSYTSVGTDKIVTNETPPVTPTSATNTVSPQTQPTVSPTPASGDSTPQPIVREIKPQEPKPK